MSKAPSHLLLLLLLHLCLCLYSLYSFWYFQKSFPSSLSHAGQILQGLSCLMLPTSAPEAVAVIITLGQRLAVPQGANAALIWESQNRSCGPDDGCEQTNLSSQDTDGTSQSLETEWCSHDHEAMTAAVGLYSYPRPPSLLLGYGSFHWRAHGYFQISWLPTINRFTQAIIADRDGNQRLYKLDVLVAYCPNIMA